jgi:Na+/H+ antiporter NhaD/arsenite permease-like protein
MDALRQIAFFSVVYLFFAFWCMQYLFPKKKVVNVNDDLLSLFERRFELLRNIAFGMLILFPLFLGIVVEVLPQQFKLSACSVGVVVALSAGFSFVEFRSYLTVIRAEKQSRASAAAEGLTIREP